MAEKTRKQIIEINSITTSLNTELRMANINEERMNYVRNEIQHLIDVIRAWKK